MNGSGFFLLRMIRRFRFALLSFHGNSFLELKVWETWKAAAVQVQVPDACRPFHASPRAGSFDG